MIWEKDIDKVNGLFKEIIKDRKNILDDIIEKKIHEESNDNGPAQWDIILFAKEGTYMILDQSGLERSPGPAENCQGVLQGVTLELW